jgi:hypothetical protein
MPSHRGWSRPDLYDRVASEGHGGEDLSVVVRAIEQLCA